MSLERDPGLLVAEPVLAPPAIANVVQQTEVVAPRDLVRWGPVLAGLVVAFTLFLLLSILLVAVGVQTIRVGDPNIDEAVGAGAIVTAIIGLLSFLVCGFVAGRTAAVVGRWAGLLNGFLVWGLGLLLVLWLTGMGLGGLLGSAGDLFQQYRAAGSPRPEADAGDILQAIRDTSVPAFLSVALPAAAAALGGWLGGREDFDPTSIYRRNVVRG